METQTLIASGLAAVLAMIVGGMWYAPFLFGNAWKRLARLPEDQNGNPAIIYGGAFVLMLIGALFFGAFIGPDPAAGFAIGAGMSAGFAWAAGSLWISYLFEGRPLKLGLINGGYHIVQYTLYGVCFWLV